MARLAALALLFGAAGLCAAQRGDLTDALLEIKALYDPDSPTFARWVAGTDPCGARAAGQLQRLPGSFG